jgi:hypothetical protein
MAAFAGPVVTVVGGGLAAIGVVAASAVIFPQLRRIRTLEDQTRGQTAA